MHQKVEKRQQQKSINKSLKKHHRYIYRVYQDSRPPRPTKVTANLKSYNIQSKNIQSKKNTKWNTSSYYRKNQIFTLQENSLWFF